ncbi:MAG TPA: SusC/RagA family TonB-linked outer membrane protein, partial [Bacteroidales bacterium]|nr:SusC/RagA family TonB-linked outer membrane protein [Bacteroidales bacterium]
MKLIFLLLLLGSAQLYAESNVLSSPTASFSGYLIPDDQQGIKISGIVRDAATKEVLIGVTVVVEGSTLGALTDLNGKFNLTVPSASSVLNISYIGYSPVRIPLNGQVFVDVVLTATTLSLEEVVIVGYGTQKKATVTGAISSIPQATLLQSPTANVSNALVGRMTGVMAQQTTGLPGSDQDVIRIRGTGTFTGSTDPLVMVDGIETANYNNIDPNEIESISILKDASATAVYGVRGANGVLIIKTKRGTLGKPQISFSSQYATSRFTDILHQWSGPDYAINYNLARAYDSYITGGYTPVFSAAAIDHYKAQDDPVFYPSVDWYNYMFNKSTGQSQDNINISGGTDKVKYFVSAGYFNQEGLINNTNIVKEYNANPTYKRYNIRSNLD